VADHHKWVTRQAVQFAHHLCTPHKAVGDDGDGRYAQPFGFNGVVQTARRAPGAGNLYD
jgi:hypothetical protein